MDAPRPKIKSKVAGFYFMSARVFARVAGDNGPNSGDEEGRPAASDSGADVERGTGEISAVEKTALLNSWPEIR